MKQRLEHRFANGKPVGELTTVEELEYLGYVDGKPTYALSALEFWRSAAITTWVGIVLAVAYVFADVH